MNDVRFVKDGALRAIRTLRAFTSPEPGDRVVSLSAQMIGLRLTAAAQAAGLEGCVCRCISSAKLPLFRSEIYRETGGGHHSRT